MPILPTGTVTFLFTDIEGSTHLWEEHPELMRAALARHDALLRTAIEQQDGHIFKTIGDAFCAAFHTAPEALQAALAAQQTLHSETWPEPLTLKVRMALHTGAAEARDNDYFGQTLNRVARLLGAGHGGQVLISAATQELVRDALPPACSLLNLGKHSLRDLNRPEIIFQLLHPNLPAEFAPLKSLDNVTLPNNLPLQITSFIGREKEIGEVTALLDQSRLLTLTGGGGSGKTRLALQVAADVLEAYPDGVWLVEFAPLADAALVPELVAQTLGVKEQAGQTPQQTLANSLKFKHLLLVLDNCEHLLSACSQLTAALLRACPGVKVLATSREALGIGGEQTYRVPSLSLPDLRQFSSPQSVSQYEAVRLFIERALLVKPAFAVTNTNAPALAQLCVRLDGIPLALELAAARVRSLSVEDINTRLDNCFRLLTGGNRAALPRQQTLRALIDWSYDLLKEQEKLLLARLSVFAGGWTLEVAEQVCSEEGIENREVLDLLTSLVDKSLVIAEERESTAQYRMLETVRQYANERLQASGDTSRVKSRHRDAFLILAEEAALQLKGAEQQRWLERLENEHDNLRSALAWCLEEEKGAEAGLRLAGALFGFWDLRGYLNVGRMYLTQALEREDAQAKTALRAQALVGAGSLACSQSDYKLACLLQEEALLILRESGDWKGIALVLNGLGNATSDQGNYTEARLFYEETLAIYRRLDNRQGVSVTLNNLAILEYEQGNYDQARLLHEETLEIQRKQGDTHGIARSLGNLAMVIFDQGRFAEAYTLQAEALAIKRDVGDKNGTARSLNHLGSIVHQQGDFLQAQNLQAEALAIQQELGDKRGISDSLHNLAKYAHLRGDYTEAQALFRECLLIRQDIEDRLGICDSLELLVDMLLPLNMAENVARLCGCADMLREALGAPLSPQDRENYDRQVAQIRSMLGEGIFTATWKEGRVMTWQQAAAYALESASF